MKKKNDPFGIEAREKIAVKRSEELPSIREPILDDKIGSYIHDCRLIIQKAEEWQRMLSNAIKGESNLKRKDLKDIQKRIRKINDVINDVHKSAKYSDEIISKLYYSNYATIEEIKRYYESWKNEERIKYVDVKAFINSDHRVKPLLEEFLNDEYESIEDVALQIVEVGAYEISVHFTAIETEMSEDRIKKKIKKIYKF